MGVCATVKTEHVFEYDCYTNHKKWKPAPVVI